MKNITEIDVLPDFHHRVFTLQSEIEALSSTIMSLSQELNACAGEAFSSQEHQLIKSRLNANQKQLAKYKEELDRYQTVVEHELITIDDLKVCSVATILPIIDIAESTRKPAPKRPPRQPILRAGLNSMSFDSWDDDSDSNSSLTTISMIKPLTLSPSSNHSMFLKEPAQLTATTHEWLEDLSDQLRNADNNDTLFSEIKNQNPTTLDESVQCIYCLKDVAPLLEELNDKLARRRFWLAIKSCLSNSMLWKMRFDKEGTTQAPSDDDLFPEQVRRSDINAI